MTGPELLVGDGQQLAAEVLGRLGFEYDAEVGSVSRRRAALCRSARTSRCCFTIAAPRRAEAREYAATWSLQPDER